VKAQWLGTDGVYRHLKSDPPFRVQRHLHDEAQRTAALARDRAGVAFRPEQRGATTWELGQ
jgi:hypothetical protein